MKQPFNYSGLLVALIISMASAITESTRQGKNAPKDLATAALLGGALASTAFLIPPRVPGAQLGVMDVLQQIVQQLGQKQSANVVPNVPTVSVEVATVPTTVTTNPISPRVPQPASPVNTPSPTVPIGELSPASEAVAQRVADIIMQRQSEAGNQ